MFFCVAHSKLEIIGFPQIPKFNGPFKIQKKHAVSVALWFLSSHGSNYQPKASIPQASLVAAAQCPFPLAPLELPFPATKILPKSDDGRKPKKNISELPIKIWKIVWK